MDAIDLLQLPLHKKYTFHFYHGTTQIGVPVIHNNQWYIVNRNAQNQDETPDKIGYPFRPEQLIKAVPVNQNTVRSFPDYGENSLVIEGSPVAKTMVIFGAGASFNYTFEENPLHFPPLANDLFADKFADTIEQFKGVENLSSQVLQSGNIEAYFQKQWDIVQNSYNPKLLNKLINTQYYLHSLFADLSSKCNNYRKNNYTSFLQSLENHLIQKGPDEKALIVSFNYDTLIENALTKTLEYRFNDFSDYVNINENRLLLFKPHGSWNWVKTFKTSYISERNMNTIDHNLSDLINLFDRRKTPLSEIYENLNENMKLLPADKNNPAFRFFYPQLLIPYKNKDSFIMPLNHQRMLEHFIKDIHTIIIVGWKGTEEKFKNLLQKNLANKKISILYVTLQDTTVEKELKELLPNAVFTNFAPHKHSKGTFTELNMHIQTFENTIFK